jgi:hypothetical protein
VRCPLCGRFGPAGGFGYRWFCHFSFGGAQASAVISFLSRRLLFISAHENEHSINPEYRLLNIEHSSFFDDSTSFPMWNPWPLVPRVRQAGLNAIRTLASASKPRRAGADLGMTR